MSRRFTLCAVILSLLLGGGVFFLFFLFIPPESGEGLGVLTMDEGAGEGEERLAALFGPDGFAGESGQWVFLTDFEGLKRIPLGAYAAALEDFDPRNDGFAARLRAFFVRGGKRFVFIPLTGGGFAKRRALEKKLGSLLEGIPFSLEFLFLRRQTLPFFVLLAAAFLGAFFLGGRMLPMFLLLPLLAPLAWGGYAGLALGALLLGIWGFSGDPLREFFVRRRYGRPPPREGKRGGFTGKSPFFPNGLGALLLFLLSVPVTLLGGLPPLPIAAGIGGFFIILALSFRFEAGGGSHIRFVPMRILSRRGGGLRPLVLMAPFALASAAGLLFSLFFSTLPGPASAAVLDDRYLIPRADYEAHVDFQASFSLRPLGGPSEGYFRYYLGEDGLIGGWGPYEGIEGGTGGNENPPFPLEKLMNFLIHYKEAGGGNSSPQITVKDCILIVLVVMPLVPLLFRVKGVSKKRKGFPFRDKRIAA